jgi:hypothetical protein
VAKLIAREFGSVLFNHEFFHKLALFSESIKINSVKKKCILEKLKIMYKKKFGAAVIKNKCMLNAIWINIFVELNQIYYRLLRLFLEREKMRYLDLDLIKHSIDQRLYRIITSLKIKAAKVVMDIGSGKRPQAQEFFKPDIIYCFDPTYETHISHEGIHMIHGTWKTAIDTMKIVPTDTVFLMDVIEHLPKQEAVSLLKETEGLVKKQIVVFTPLGFMEQDDGEWNTHRSGWLPEDFKVGWKTFVFPNFHRTGLKDRVLEKPHGALLAIYNKPRVA